MSIAVQSHVARTQACFSPISVLPEFALRLRYLHLQSTIPTLLCASHIASHTTIRFLFRASEVRGLLRRFDVSGMYLGRVL